MTPCKCGDEWDDCTVHVECDENCRALIDANTADEWRAAALHWRSHSYLGGCSHAR